LKPGGNYDLVNLYVNRRVSLQKRDLVKVWLIKIENWRNFNLVKLKVGKTLHSPKRDLLKLKNGETVTW
jgi:hypothetical protein